MLRRLQRFFGLLLPAAWIALIRLQPKLLESLGLDQNLVLLVLLTWFLLAVDANLGLGLVDKIVKVAREIKELNSCVTNRIALLRLALSGPQRVFLKSFTFAYSPWRKRLPPPRGYSA
jgi:hypothetical protein